MGIVACDCGAEPQNCIVPEVDSEGGTMNADRGSLSESEEASWVDALREGLAESDRRIREAALSDGWSLVHHRGRIIREAMKSFLQHVVREMAPRGAFAIHALGGTGRQEICPGSDVDLGIVVENIEENEHFFRHVSQQLSKFSPLVPGLKESIKVNALPDLADKKHFDLTSLASRLDADFLIGDVAFDQRIRRICQQRAAELGLEFIFSINQDLRQFDQNYPQPPGDVGGFHVKDGIGGLRNFHMTMWLYSFERWIPSVQVYEQVRSTRRFDSEGAPTPKVLSAVSVLFSTRCWIEQRRADQRRASLKGNSPTSPRSSRLIDVGDMEAFLARFGAEGLTALNAARETISSYRRETLDRLLEQGVVVPDTEGLVVWGPNGLHIGADATFKDATKMFYTLYAAQQRLHLPIDRSTKRAAQKNIAESLRPDAAFIQLMATAGPILPALSDCSEYGILDKLIPGFDQLSSRLYRPGHRAATLTRAARAMQRIEGLEYLSSRKPANGDSIESYFLRQYQAIGESALCALRLALLTEEIPETLYDSAEPYASSVHGYANDCLKLVPGMSGEIVRTVEFLLLMKRELLKASEMSDQLQVLESWRQRIRELKSRDSADTIRALALFAYAAFDFNKPKGVHRDRLDFEQWQNVQNLTQNLLYDALGLVGQPFLEHYFDETGKRIGRVLPRRLLASPHLDNSLKTNYEGTEALDPQRAHRIIHALREVLQTGRPKVEIVRSDESFRLTLFAWDFPGLFWRVAGALLDADCSIRSTDLYGIPDPDGQATDGDSLIPGERRLIFDVLTFDPPREPTESWRDDLKARILQRLANPEEHILDDTAEILQSVMEVLSPKLTDLGSGQLKFSCHSPASNKSMRYAISRLLSERAAANIESIARDGTHDWPVPRTNFYIRVQSDVETVANALRNALGEVPIFVESFFTTSTS